MATRTSSQTGNWSDTATWGGAAKPGAGDIAIISSGHTVTVDEDTTVGDKSSGVGRAVRVQATDSTTYGVLVVPNGVTLTLRGYDTGTNLCGQVDRYAKFKVEAGGALVLDVASDWASFLLVDGILEAIGTSGNHCAIRGSASPNWNNAVTNEATTGDYNYRTADSIARRRFANRWISNAAGTGIGSMGDTSFAFNGATTPSLTTEVATIADVNASGKYCIDYENGGIYWYDTGASPTINVDYKYLTFNGSALYAYQDQTYNAIRIQYCDFSYMGSTSGTQPAIYLANRKSAAVASNQEFYLKDSTVRFNKWLCYLTYMTGTSGDPIVISGNYLGDCAPNGLEYGMFACRYQSDYVSFTGNQFNTRGVVFTHALGATLTGFKFTGNTGTVGGSLISATTDSPLPNLSVASNTIIGMGASGDDGRLIANASGTAGNPIVIEDNDLRYLNRLMHLGSYVTFRRNVCGHVYHHGITSAAANYIKTTSALIENNLFFGESSAYGSPWIELGYNKWIWQDDITVRNNTCVGNPWGLISTGDLQDAGGCNFSTRIRVANNIVQDGNYAFRYGVDTATLKVRSHPIVWDYNVTYSQATSAYEGWTSGGGFFSISGVNYNDDDLVTRNVTGVALFDASFASATGKSLVFTYTSATNQTLAWDGGTAIQLVLDSGTATGGGSNYLNCTGKSWDVNYDNAGSPVGCWIRITGGTGVGQIRAVLAAPFPDRVTVGPAWDTNPDATSTFIIVKSTVTLDDGADTVKASIYLPDLPTSSQTDSANIDYAEHDVTTDPLLVDATGTAATDYHIGAASPAKDAGIAAYAAAEDYLETARPVGAADDMGFYEAAAASVALAMLL